MGLRVFGNRELEAADRILRHVERGGTAVLEGRWERVLRLREWLAKRCRDKEALQRLALRASGDWVRTVEPPIHLPYLPLITGSPILEEYLVPLEELVAGLAAQAALHPVEALGASLVVHRNVLVPRSQPLIHLLRRAMEAQRPDLPASPSVLDMGCGSGVCALVAAQVWPAARITATDHLPEAIATTRINVDRMEAAGLIRPGAVQVTQPGDLFEHLGGARYDLIIFNAPWVVAPARNRAETALNDAGQATVRRFLSQAATRLNQGGRVLLGYANHSGESAIGNLERFIAEAGLRVVRRHTDRIKTHRAHRSWQAIYAYDLCTGPNDIPEDRAGRGGESDSVDCAD
ncbi:MAG: methyltransferase [Bacillota bacterium]